MQLLYEAALCIWQLTFLHEAAEVIASSSGIVVNLVEIARTAQKEKVRVFCHAYALIRINHTGTYAGFMLLILWFTCREYLLQVSKWTIS